MAKECHFPCRRCPHACGRRWSNRARWSPLRVLAGGFRPVKPAIVGKILFSTMKIELIYRRSWHTRNGAENELFRYIDRFYNTKRIQKDLGGLGSDEYEAAWHSPDRTDCHSGTTDRSQVPIASSRRGSS